jgi:hypothetical protein
MAEAAIALGADSTDSVISLATDETISTAPDAAAADVGGDAAASCANSFTADTPVTMAGGSRKPIKDIEVGDKVLATDPQTGDTKAEPVEQLIRHSGKHQMVLVGLEDGSVLDSTNGHPIWDATTGRFTRAANLHAGDKIETSNAQLITITTLTGYSTDLTAYNLQISTIHTYYAGATPVLVHNSCGPDYHARVRARGLDDPTSHNFPYTYDKTILESTPTVQDDGSLLYRVPGAMNGKDGVYEIGLNPNTNTVFHRFFRPYK